MKYALAEVPVYGFNAARLCFSALLLWGLARRERRNREPQPLGPARWRRVLAVATLGGLVYQLLFMTGVDLTSAGNVGLLIASAPLWTAVIARRTGIERVSTRASVGIALGFAGTAWIAIEGGEIDFASCTARGNLLVVGAAVCWAAATVLSKPLVQEISPTRLAYLSAVTMLPLHLLIGLPWLGSVVRLQISLGAWACIAYAGLLSTGLAYSMWNYWVQQVGPSHSATYTNLVPVIALLSNTWILGESVGISQISGGLLVLGGLLVMRWRARTPGPALTRP